MIEKLEKDKEHLEEKEDELNETIEVRLHRKTETFTFFFALV